jgi:hypothetical protein
MTVDNGMNNRRQISRKHHFVPRFYLCAWHNADGEGFWLYRHNQLGCIELHRRNAASIGFEKDLYILRPDGLTQNITPSDDLETGFFSPIDDAASIVHKKLLMNGVSSLSFEDRAIWALFLNSLIERSPERIQRLVKDIDLDANDALLKLKLRWGSLHGNSTHKSQFLKNIDVAALCRNTVLRGITQFIFDDAFIEYICKMEWRTFDLPVGPDHFLTSDSPVVMNAAAHDFPINMLSIALSPTRLLLINRTDDAFDANFMRKVAITHSIQMGKQAEKYLISSVKLVDSPYVKYTRIANEIFRPELTLKGPGSHIF